MLPEYGMAFCRDGISIFSDDYYCAGEYRRETTPCTCQSGGLY
ncbi:hypothetical protein HMPREF9533_01844 [Escherichia coli MS 60-1]|nr:hypothetical protein EcF11_1423 [Escherichia coli F11]EGB83310.1 hypothetical protein HMPREF9533_01844 [Escherichia coli MS 60-1]